MPKPARRTRDLVSGRRREECAVRTLVERHPCERLVQTFDVVGGTARAVVGGEGTRQWLEALCLFLRTVALCVSRTCCGEKRALDFNDSYVVVAETSLLPSCSTVFSDKHSARKRQCESGQQRLASGARCHRKR